MRLSSVFVLFIIITTVSAQDDSGCTVSGCHSAIVEKKVIHPAAQGDCLICHESNDNEHPKGGGNEFTLADEGSELCYVCHNSKQTMPNIHPPVDDGECLICHNPHSSDYESLTNDQPGALCLECHELEPEGPYVHGPVAGQACIACHNPHQSERQALLKLESPDLCVFCHEDTKKQLAMSSVHPPFEDYCLGCHKPHSSAAKFMLRQDVPQLCYTCHEAVEVAINAQPRVHGPFQKGGKCYDCHDGHATNNEPLLKKPEQELCFKCHNKSFEAHGHQIRNIGKLVLRSSHLHEPLKEDGCSACHEAHSPGSFLLSAAFPEGTYSEGKVGNFALCFDCHDSDLMERSKTTDATNFRNGSRNLHYVHVNRKKARNCTTCHEIHGSNNPFLIAEKVQFGQWAMDVTYEKTANGGTCLAGCHRKLEYNRQTPVDYGTNK